MSKTSFIFAFALGAAAGSVVAWRLLKEKYERLAQEEIDSVKETFSRRKQDDIPEEDVKKEVTVEEKGKYDNVLKREGYVNYSEISSKKGGDNPMEHKKPYVISPDAFGEYEDDYETESLTYYSDGILADESDDVIENVDDLIGTESLDHFGEYEEDSVFVRNERLKTDYEILKDHRKYTDVCFVEE